MGFTGGGKIRITGQLFALFLMVLNLAGLTHGFQEGVDVLIRGKVKVASGVLAWFQWKKLKWHGMRVGIRGRTELVDFLIAHTRMLIF